MIMVLPVLGDFSFISSLGVRDAVDQTDLGGMGGVTEEVKKSCYKHTEITVSFEFLKMNLRCVCVCVCVFLGFRV
jgi:hypothetical protein